MFMNICLAPSSLLSYDCASHIAFILTYRDRQMYLQQEGRFIVSIIAFTSHEENNRKFNFTHSLTSVHRCRHTHSDNSKSFDIKFSRCPLSPSPSLPQEICNHWTFNCFVFTLVSELANKLFHHPHWVARDICVEQENESGENCFVVFASTRILTLTMKKVNALWERKHCWNSHKRSRYRWSLIPADQVDSGAQGQDEERERERRRKEKITNLLQRASPVYFVWYIS